MGGLPRFSHQLRDLGTMGPNVLPLTDHEVRRYVRLSHDLIMGDEHMLDDSDWDFIESVWKRLEVANR